MCKLESRLYCIYGFNDKSKITQTLCGTRHFSFLVINVLHSGLYGTRSRSDMTLLVHMLLEESLYHTAMCDFQGGGGSAPPVPLLDPDIQTLLYRRHTTGRPQCTGLPIRVLNLKLFSYSSNKTYVVGTQKNRLNETVLLRT